MSFTSLTMDWSDAAVVPAIRYPSVFLGSTDLSGDFVFASVESFDPGRSTPGLIVDSLNNHNMGNIEQPSRYTCNLVCLPTGKAFELINECSNGRRYFDLILAPASYFDVPTIDESVGDVENAWGIGKAVFVGCKVRDTRERYSVNGKPTVTFSCTAMRYSMGEGDSRIEIGNGRSGPQMSDASLGIPTE